jgi:hypothetical protein
MEWTLLFGTQTGSLALRQPPVRHHPKMPMTTKLGSGCQTRMTMNIGDRELALSRPNPLWTRSSRICN